MVKISKNKKPAILKTKVELAHLIRDTVKPHHFNKSPAHNFYWCGEYKINNINYRIYFQYYSTGLKRMQVDYVDIQNNDTHKALTVKEINQLLTDLKQQNENI